MKLDVTPEEALSLYDLLLKARSSESLKQECVDLDRLLHRIKSSILLGLSNPVISDPFESWIKNQEAKLASLRKLDDDKK